MDNEVISDEVLVSALDSSGSEAQAVPKQSQLSQTKTSGTPQQRVALKTRGLPQIGVRLLNLHGRNGGIFGGQVMR